MRSPGPVFRGGQREDAGERRLKLLQAKKLAQLERQMAVTGQRFVVQRQTLPDGTRLRLTVSLNGPVPVRKAVVVARPVEEAEECELGLPLFANYGGTAKPEVAFYGDSCGYVWRHTIDPSTPEPVYVDGVWVNQDEIVWGERVRMFRAFDPDGRPQGIYEKPQIVYHPTGSGTLVLIATGLRGERRRGSFYGLWDRGDLLTYPLRREDLLVQTVTGEAVHPVSGLTMRVSTRNEPNWCWPGPACEGGTRHTGWVLDLPEGMYLAEPAALWAIGTPPLLMIGGGTPPSGLHNWRLAGADTVFFHLRDADDRRWLGGVYAGKGFAGSSISGEPCVDGVRDGVSLPNDRLTGATLAEQFPLMVLVPEEEA